MSVIPVLISISSLAHREEVSEDEKMTMLVSGELELEDDRAVIRYEETLDESMPPQKIEVIVEDESVTMLRGGAYATQMVFRMGSRYEGMYHTPYGEMELAVYSTRVDYDIGEDGGTLELSYQLDLNGKFAAVHDMELHLFANGTAEN
jgi:uncharacterized beta-barrel protein YwiB (DUF1934 family)